MATRQEIQTAQDIIKSANICHDLFNMAAKIARGEIPNIVSVGETVEEAPMTIEEIQAALVRQMDNILGYTQQATRYLAVAGNRDRAIAGLGALGVDLTTLQADMQAFGQKLDQVKAAVASADTQPGLDAIGNDIDNEIPPLNLLRNA